MRTPVVSRLAPIAELSPPSPRGRASPARLFAAAGAAARRRLSLGVNVPVNARPARDAGADLTSAGFTSAAPPASFPATPSRPGQALRLHDTSTPLATRPGSLTCNTAPVPSVAVASPASSEGTPVFVTALSRPDPTVTALAGALGRRLSLPHAGPLGNLTLAVAPAPAEPLGPVLPTEADSPRAARWKRRASLAATPSARLDQWTLPARPTPVAPAAGLGARASRRHSLGPTNSSFAPAPEPAPAASRRQSARVPVPLPPAPPVAKARTASGRRQSARLPSRQPGRPSATAQVPSRPARVRPPPADDGLPSYMRPTIASSRWAAR